MDIKQLNYFRAIVEKGSYRKAAESVHISPSALSLSIKKLEEELGVRLLDRDRGRVSVTVYGQSLYDSARDVTETIRSARDKLEEIKGIAGGEVVLGLLPFDAVAEMGSLLGQFIKRFPNLRVQTELGIYSQLIDMLHDGHIDFMITEANNAVMDKRFVYESLFKTPYRLLVGRQHSLVGKKNVSLKRVLDYPLAYRSDAGSQLEGWTKTFEAKGMEVPRSYLSAGTDVFYRYLIRECELIAALPVIGVIKDAIETGELVELDIADTRWFSTISLVYRKNQTFSPAANLLLNQTREALAS